MKSVGKEISVFPLILLIIRLKAERSWRAIEPMNSESLPLLPMVMILPIKLMLYN